MRLFTAFLIICVVFTFLFFNYDVLLTSDYEYDTMTVYYVENGNVLSKQIDVVGMPMTDYLSNNSFEISNLSYSFQQKMNEARSFTDMIYRAGKSAIDVAGAVTGFYTDYEGTSSNLDNMNIRQVYNSEPSFRSFSDTVWDRFNDYYDACGYNFFESYLLIGSTGFYLTTMHRMFLALGQSSDMMDYQGGQQSYSLRLIDPSSVVRSGVDPLYYISIQDSLAKWGVDSFYIDTSSGFNIHPIYQRYYSRSRLNGKYVVTLLSEELTHYKYNSANHSIFYYDSE